MIIDDKILIEYIENRLGSLKGKEVETWIASSVENREYFILLKNVYTKETMPSIEATSDELNEIKGSINIEERRKRRLQLAIPYFAVALLLLFIFLNYFYSDGSVEKKDFIINDSMQSNNVLYTDNGVKAKTVLPDGTEVWLNSGTKLTYPNKFVGKFREVYISGEAFFKVQKDSIHPMIVSTPKNFKVEVIGTTFNLRAYYNDNEARATLYTGKINIIKDGKDIVLLTSNESYIISTNNQTNSRIDNSNIDNQSVWKDGILIFDNIPLSEALKRIERWHGAKFIVNDSSILQKNVTASFESESLIQIMDLLKISGILNYSVKDNTIILSK